MKKIIFLIFFSTLTFASGYNDVIYTWRYTGIIDEILQGVKGVITGVDTLVKAAMGIAFFIFAIRKAVDNRVNPAVVIYGRFGFNF